MVSRLVRARLVLSAEKISALLEKFYRWLIALGSTLRSPMLLAIRFSGAGNFFSPEREADGPGETHAIFREPRHSLPSCPGHPGRSVECFGGLLLLIGLASRLISVPLMILLTVAYLTADIDRVRAIFSDPDKFVTADEFLFLFAVVIVFVFGPGAFSLDAFIGKISNARRRKGADEFAPECGQDSDRPGRQAVAQDIRSENARGPLKRAQQRKILRPFAKILLPSKRPFIELATRAPQAIQSKPVFHF